MSLLCGLVSGCPGFGVLRFRFVQYQGIDSRFGFGAFGCCSFERCRFTGSGPPLGLWFSTDLRAGSRLEVQIRVLGF